MLNPEALGELPQGSKLDQTALQALQSLPQDKQKYVIQAASSQNLKRAHQGNRGVSKRVSKMVTKIARNTYMRLPLRARMSLAKRFYAILWRARYTDDITIEFARSARKQVLEILSSDDKDDKDADDEIRQFCYTWLQCGDVLTPGIERAVVNGIQPELDTVARYYSIPGKDNKALIADSLSGDVDDDLNAATAYLYCNTNGFDSCPICLSWIDEDVHVLSTCHVCSSKYHKHCVMMSCAICRQQMNNVPSDSDSNILSD